MNKKPLFNCVDSMRLACFLSVLLIISGCNLQKNISDIDLDSIDITEGELGEDYFLVDTIEGVLTKEKLRLTGKVHTDLGFPVENVIIKSISKKANDTLLYEKDLGQSDTSGLFSIEIRNPTQGNILISFQKDIYLTRIYNVSSLVKSKFNKRNTVANKRKLN